MSSSNAKNITGSGTWEALYISFCKNDITEMNRSEVENLTRNGTGRTFCISFCQNEVTEMNVNKAYNMEMERYVSSAKIMFLRWKEIKLKT